jgi:hypothetical protein
MIPMEERETRCCHKRPSRSGVAETSACKAMVEYWAATARDYEILACEMDVSAIARTLETRPGRRAAWWA